METSNEFASPPQTPLSLESIRTGSTRTPVLTWMAISRRRVSAKGWKNLVAIPTQRYDVPPGKVKNEIVSILALDLDGVWICNWNAKPVIFFNTVIMKHT